LDTTAPTFGGRGRKATDRGGERDRPGLTQVGVSNRGEPDQFLPDQLYQLNHTGKGGGEGKEMAKEMGGGNWLGESNRQKPLMWGEKSSLSHTRR